jgi:hypothetical protein
VAIALINWQIGFHVIHIDPFEGVQVDVNEGIQDFVDLTTIFDSSVAVVTIV